MALNTLSPSYIPLGKKGSELGRWSQNSFIPSQDSCLFCFLDTKLLVVSLGKCIWPLGHFSVHPLCQTKCHCPFCEAGRQTRRHGGSMQRRGEQAEWFSLRNSRGAQTGWTYPKVGAKVGLTPKLEAAKRSLAETLVDAVVCA